jgi:hypothetical protein
VDNEVNKEREIFFVTRPELISERIPESGPIKSFSELSKPRGI